MSNSQAEADLGLFQATEDGDFQKARRALALGANVESTTRRDTCERITSLMLASKGGYAEVVQLLLEAGEKADRKTRSAIEKPLGTRKRRLNRLHNR